MISTSTRTSGTRSSSRRSGISCSGRRCAPRVVIVAVVAVARSSRSPFPQAAEEEAREEANEAADAARAAEAERKAAAERADVDAQRERLRRSLEATERAEADAAARGRDEATRQGGGGGGTFGLASAARPGDLGEFGPDTAEIADDVAEEWTDEVRNAVVRQLVPAFDNLPAEETVRAT